MSRNYLHSLEAERVCNSQTDIQTMNNPTRTRFYQPYTKSKPQHATNNAAAPTKRSYQEYSDTEIDHQTTSATTSYIPSKYRSNLKDRAATTKPATPVNTSAAGNNEPSSILPNFSTLSSLVMLLNVPITVNLSVILQYLTYSLCFLLLIIWLFPESVLFIVVTIMIIFLTIVRYVLNTQEYKTLINGCNNGNSSSGGAASFIGGPKIIAATTKYNPTKLDQLRAEVKRKFYKEPEHDTGAAAKNASNKNSSTSNSSSSSGSSSSDSRSTTDNQPEFHGNEEENLN